MNRPTIKSGRFHAGADFRCGERVVVDVADEVVLGDRCVLGDDTYLCGRSVRVGDDFFGYSHWNRRLEVGLGRRDEEDAVLTVGSRCTFHDNRIDLSRRVTVGDDVGLSPEVTIYCHYYWNSVLEGYPCKFAPVQIGNGVIVGYRTTILPGVTIPDKCVIGAGAVLAKADTYQRSIYGGVPAKRIGWVVNPETPRAQILGRMIEEYYDRGWYRGLTDIGKVEMDYPLLTLSVKHNKWTFDVENLTVTGSEENEYSDDFRWFLFQHGVRIYTQRPFAKLPRKQ